MSKRDKKPEIERAPKRDEATDAENHHSLGAIVPCQHCGYEYTHQYEVRVFWRKEDETHINRVCTTLSGVHSVRMENRGNPSPRRQGVQIRIECESCDKISFINIVQHKGQTFINYEKGKL